MKTKYYYTSGNKTYKVSLWEIVLYILSFFVLLYFAIYTIGQSQKSNRLKTEGVCTIVTVTEIIEKTGKGGYGARVKYLVRDTVLYSSVGSGYNTRLKRNSQYWARYLPDKPHFINLLRDENDNLIPFEEPSKIPSICNCQNEPN